MANRFKFIKGDIEENEAGEVVVRIVMDDQKTDKVLIDRIVFTQEDYERNAEKVERRNKKLKLAGK